MKIRQNIALFSAFCAACASTVPTPNAARSAAARSTLESYLPLQSNSVFSYETSSTENPGAGILVLSVERPSSDLAELNVAGRVQRLNVAQDSIQTERGGFLLKLPLEPGAEWQGDTGTVKVVDLAKSIQVPAGQFANCLETREEGEREGAVRRTITVYCPDIGIVYRRNEAQADGQLFAETLSLKSFGQRVSL